MRPPLRYPVSGDPMRSVFRTRLLGRHDVQYHYCDASGLLRTEPTWWLDEAYGSAIASTDTGLVQRNLGNAAMLEPLVARLGLAQGRILDVAGGYGLLTRLLRHRGFAAYSTDPYCQNLFAARHEPGAGFRADLLLAFEVLEHVEDGPTFVASLFERYGCRTLVCSTTTSDGEIHGPDWDYYAFETGQHISFYQPRTLQHLAERVGARYLRLRSGLHLITDRTLQDAFASVKHSGLLTRWAAWRTRRALRGLSLTMADHEAARSALQAPIDDSGR